jgi:TorA maturation chaperone TorD
MYTECVSQGNGADEAATRSAGYAFMATAFRFPDAEVRSQISILGRSGLPAEAAATLEGLNGQAPRDLSEQYGALFGHTVRGACPPYELEYGPGEIVQRAPDLADICGFYAAFGLTLSPECADRPDHISAECEFMSVLCAKEAFALQTGETEMGDSCRSAQRAFLKDHVSKWVPAFAQRILDAGPAGFYAQAARFTLEFLASECRRFDLAAGPATLELRPVDAHRDAAIECGVEELCPSEATP